MCVCAGPCCWLIETSCSKQGSGTLDSPGSLQGRRAANAELGAESGGNSRELGHVLGMGALRTRTELLEAAGVMGMAAREFPNGLTNKDQKLELTLYS